MILHHEYSEQVSKSISPISKININIVSYFPKKISFSAHVTRQKKPYANIAVSRFFSSIMQKQTKRSTSYESFLAKITVWFYNPRLSFFKALIRCMTKNEAWVIRLLFTNATISFASLNKKRVSSVPCLAKCSNS